MCKLTPAQKQWLADFGVSMGLDSEPGDAADSKAEGFQVTRVSASTEMSSGSKSRRLSATFEVRWAEDSDQFYQRVLKAIRADSAFKGVSAEQLNAVSSTEPQSLMALVATFHQNYAMRHSDRRAGQKLTVRFSADYSANPQIWSSSLTGKTLSLVEDAVAAKPEKERSAAAVPSGPAAMLARQAAESDRKGWAGMKFSVKNDGRSTVVTSMEKVGPQSARPTGARELSQAAALKELESFMANASEHKGVWEGHFARDPKTGAMVFMKWAKGPDSPEPPPPPPPAPARRPLSKGVGANGFDNARAVACQLGFLEAFLWQLVE